MKVDLSRLHRRSRRRVPWLQTVCLLALAPVFGTFGLLGRLRISGREHIPNGGYIVIANHPSIFDPIFIAVALRRRIRFMGKSELFAGEFGSLFSRLGGFPVQRGKWDTDAFDTSIAVLGRGRVFAMFPEGGTVDEKGKGTLGKARPGLGYVAARSGADIVPIHLSNTGAVRHWWRLPKIEVRIGPPLAGAHSAEDDRDLHQQIAQRALDAVYAIS